MSLESGFGPGLEIETRTETEIILDFIRNNWPVADPYIPNLPIKSKIDFGASPDRRNKDITLRVYRIFSNVIDKDIGSMTYAFNVPCAIDVFILDSKAAGERRESTKLVAIESYLRDFITNNRIGLRSKGINNIRLDSIEYINEPATDEKDIVWYHLVVTVRAFYHMHRTSD